MGQCWSKVSPSKTTVCNAENIGLHFLQFFRCPKRNKKGKQKPGLCPEVTSKNGHHITSKQSWEEKLAEATQDGKILVANFSAPWSAPCKSIGPIYGKLADNYNSLVFLTIDVDALAEISNSWDICATPTFIFIKEGKQVDKFVGADDVELRKKIAAVAGN